MILSNCTGGIPAEWIHGAGRYGNDLDGTGCQIYANITGAGNNVSIAQDCIENLKKERYEPWAGEGWRYMAVSQCVDYKDYQGAGEKLGVGKALLLLGLGVAVVGGAMMGPAF